MYLGQLLKSIRKEYRKIPIRGISFDSRKAKKNDIFFAIDGNKTFGSNFIKDAISKGVSAIVTDSKIQFYNSKIPLVKVSNVRRSLSEACSNFYRKKPSSIVAVTGTNGKTSVSNFFFQLFNLNRVRVAAIGTLGIESNLYRKKTDLTSPDPLFLHKSLAELKKRKIEKVILEASSHGLDQKRLDHINFRAAVFTNLSRDHLDYHKTMSRYLNSKLYLFKNLLNKKAFCITNEKNFFLKKLKKIVLRRKIKIYLVGFEYADLKILSQKYKGDFQQIQFLYNNKVYDFKTSLIGNYQIKNLLLAILTAEKCGLSIQKSLKKVQYVSSVKGRLECIKKLENNSRIFVDFAHTPDALVSVLKNLKFQFEKNISIVFGCGGDRDQGKRSIMGRIASQYCKKIYVTDDNPRYENSKNIRREIKAGINIDYQDIGNRKLAIYTAIRELGYNEILLIAGKGHEQYQDLGSKKIYFSDENVVKNYFKSKNYKNKSYYWYSSIISEVFKKNKIFNYSNVSINSKTVNYKTLFFAIKGNKKDGHSYVKEALSNGAVKAVVDKHIRGVNYKKLIKIPNTLVALNNLATTTRQCTKAKIIGITGSSGKTTLKDIAGFALSKFGNTYFSKYSFNNHYGVPLSLSNLKEKDDFGVFELGMSKSGEINSLSKILKPDVAIITNVSSAHLENFKNLKDIAKAKAEVINNIKLYGTLILNRDDKFYNYIAQKAKRKNIQVKSFGLNKNADLYLKNIKIGKYNYIITISFNKQTYLFRVKYNHNTFIQNILSTCLLIFILDLDIANKKNIFLNFKIPEGRGDFSRVYAFRKFFYLLDESYNANPNSVRLAIDRFKNINKKKNKKILLLGDMLELGKGSKPFHRNIAKYINNSNIDKIFVIGKYVPETYKFVKKEKKGAIIKKINDVGSIIMNHIKSNDLVMIKGSNATGLNDFSKKLKRGTMDAL